MRPRPLLFWLLACLLSLACAYKATYQQLSNTKILEEKHDDLAAEVDGTADRPYVFRVLTPFLVRSVNSLAPGKSLPGGVGGLVRGRCSPTLPCPTLAAYSLVAPTLFFLFLITTFAAAHRILASDLWALASVLLSFFLANALLLRHLSHIYDFGTLFFAALLLLTASSRRSTLFFVTLMLACANKESLILYSFAFAAIRWNDSTSRKSLLDRTPAAPLPNPGPSVTPHDPSRPLSQPDPATPATLRDLSPPATHPDPAPAETHPDLAPRASQPDPGRRLWPDPGHQAIWRDRTRRILLPLAVQLAGFLVLYTLIGHHFAQNPGTPVQIHLLDWIDYLGATMTLPALLLTLLALWLPFAGFAAAPPTLRQASVILLPWLLLLFIGGGPGELRVLFEVLPLLVLLTCAHLQRTVFLLAPLR